MAEAERIGGRVMFDAARVVLRGWAAEVAGEHGEPRAEGWLDRVRAAEIKAGGVWEVMRQAMAQLDRDLYATAIVAYRENGIARDRVRTIRAMTGREFSVREYFNRMKLIEYFAAGYFAGTGVES